MTNLAEHDTAALAGKPRRMRAEEKTPLIAEGEVLLRDPDAARYVGMSESWLRQTRMMGRTDGPPFVRVGTRSIRYRRRDLDRWIEQRCSSALAAVQHDEDTLSIEQRRHGSAEATRTALASNSNRRRQSPITRGRKRSA